MKRPSLKTASKNLYLQAPPQLEKATRPNLNKSLEELIHDDEEVSITDPNIPFSLKLKLKYV